MERLISVAATTVVVSLAAPVVTLASAAVAVAWPVVPLVLGASLAADFLSSSTTKSESNPKPIKI